MLVPDWLPWAGFTVFVLAMLALDLGVFHRKAHQVSTREALIWTGVWIALAMVFCGGVWWFEGSEPALEFLTGYLVEKALSIDNIFVMLVIFGVLGIPAKYQHKVLFWGILGALVFRVIFILAGLALLKTFHGMIYVFGVLLILTGVKLAFQKEHEIDPERSLPLRLMRRLLPTTNDHAEGRFIARREGHRGWAVTPLFAALVLVEVTDLMFAVDSIPAILAISQDPFIVYTSNVFAILGLRSLFFALAGVLQKFHHLHFGLAAILAFVGVKMLLVDTYKIPTAVSLGVIAGIVVLSVVASLIWPKRTETVPAASTEGDGGASPVGSGRADLSP